MSSGINFYATIVMMVDEEKEVRYFAGLSFASGEPNKVYVGGLGSQEIPQDMAMPGWKMQGEYGKVKVEPMSGFSLSDKAKMQILASLIMHDAGVDATLEIQQQQLASPEAIEVAQRIIVLD